MTSTVGWTPGLTGLGPSVVALGAFDGVHLGHQALIRRMCEIAQSGRAARRRRHLRSRPGDRAQRARRRRGCWSRRRAWSGSSALGADLVLVVPFTPELAAWSPERFVDELLVPALAPGHRGRGSRVPVRRAGGGRRGDAAGGGRARRLRRGGGRARSRWTASASARRASGGFSPQGDVAGAAHLLGRAHFVRGPVHEGRGEGEAKLGMPTANVQVGEHVMLPAAGVYAGIVTLPDGERRAAAVVGGPPADVPRGPRPPGGTRDRLVRRSLRQRDHRRVRGAPPRRRRSSGRWRSWRRRCVRTRTVPPG